MKVDDFEKVIEGQINECREVLIVKAKEYATTDRLHNFKVAAEVQGMEPIQALAGMMAKHTVSVYDMCKCEKDYSQEMWREKLTDHINYLMLLKALVEEKMEEKKSRPCAFDE